MSNPLPIYRLIHDGTRVISLAPAVGRTYPPKGQSVFDGTQADCQAKIAALNLTPPPDPALVAAKAAKLASLADALNASLTKLFGSAPIQAQVTFCNITKPIADLISAGQVAQAEAALSGMLTDQLVPPGYSAFIDPAVAAIVAAAPRFAAVQAAATVAAVQAVV